MVKHLFTIRHAFKLKTGNNEKWKNSRRYKENMLDTPLHPNGFINASFIGIELINLHNKNLINLFKLKYIYSSPFTRCCQTAIEIIKMIKKILNHDVKLRLNSKLLDICFIDDQEHENMINDNVYYINVLPYTYSIDFNDMAELYYNKMLNSNIIDKNIFLNKIHELNKSYVVKKINKDEIDIHPIISKQLLKYLDDFFNEI